MSSLLCASDLIEGRCHLSAMHQLQLTQEDFRRCFKVIEIFIFINALSWKAFERLKNLPTFHLPKFETN